MSCNNSYYSFEKLINKSNCFCNNFSNYPILRKLDSHELKNVKKKICINKSSLKINYVKLYKKSQ